MSFLGFAFQAWREVEVILPYFVAPEPCAFEKEFVRLILDFEFFYLQCSLVCSGRCLGCEQVNSSVY